MDRWETAWLLVYKSLQIDGCKGRSPKLRKPLIDIVVLHCGSTIIRGVARKIPEVIQKVAIFSSPSLAIS